MKSKFIAIVLSAFFFSNIQPFVFSQQKSLITKEAIQMIKSLMDDDITFGVAIGVVTREGSEIYCIGKTAKKGGKEIDKDTVFRLGSVTKVFTGILFADLVLKNTVNLYDPLDKYLPKSVADH